VLQSPVQVRLRLMSKLTSKHVNNDAQPNKQSNKLAVLTNKLVKLNASKTLSKLMSVASSLKIRTRCSPAALRF
jgi:hypothetical protein